MKRLFRSVVQRVTRATQTTRASGARQASTVASQTGDGVGQTFLDDLRFFYRFLMCRRREVRWRRPTHEETRQIEQHPCFGRFGDETIAIANHDERIWIVRERFWHGWPDPPRFVFFALDGEAVWSAADFDQWPSQWLRPGQSEPHTPPRSGRP